MPRYEYRCRSCGSTFEINRPMSESGAATSCPQGHDDTVKLLSTVSLGGASGPAASGGGGGGWGGSGGRWCGVWVMVTVPQRSGRTAAPGTGAALGGQVVGVTLPPVILPPLTVKVAL